MEDLQKLLKELEELTKEEPKTQPQAQTQTSQSASSQQTTPNNSGVEEQFRAWKELGLIRFGSQYGHLKNFSKILNLVIPKADQRVLADIQAGRVKDEYFDYLEEAYNETIKEIASFSKDLLSSQFQASRQKTAPSQPQTSSYNMNDYYNEYKKYLETITAKDVATIKFLDGIEENGKIRQTGIPKASIRENIILDDN
ncbi:MAG: hypothetical protein JHC31_13430 [Sulfurihydrogenibium sp.]|jgi:hypothetical protein|nr:hypothetical protein [Sulfurihydrogenibium sp.]